MGVDWSGVVALHGLQVHEQDHHDWPFDAAATYHNDSVGHYYIFPSVVHYDQHVVDHPFGKVASDTEDWKVVAVEEEVAEEQYGKAVGLA